MSEYKGFYHCSSEILWIRNILEELGFKQIDPTPMYTDSSSAIGTSENPVNQSSLRGIQTLYHATRDMIEQGHIEVIHVPAHEELADIFTKPLDAKTFISFRDQIVADPGNGERNTRMRQERKRKA